MTTQTTSTGKLAGKRIAILATDGFEQSELEEPQRAFREAGAETVIVSLEKKDIQGMNHDEKGDRFTVGLVVADARANDFDALLLPGGVKNPDSLRTDDAAVAFVKAFATAGKPIAAICHGPWTLVEADVVRGRKVTSYPSIKTDLKNAGASWVDEEVVVDAGLVTSRKPADIPAFVAKAIEEIAEGKHARQRTS